MRERERERERAREINVYFEHSYLFRISETPKISAD